jgi:hypothetical protein
MKLMPNRFGLSLGSQQSEICRTLAGEGPASGGSSVSAMFCLICCMLQPSESCNSRTLTMGLKIQLCGVSACFCPTLLGPYSVGEFPEGGTMGVRRKFSGTLELWGVRASHTCRMNSVELSTTQEIMFLYDDHDRLTRLNNSACIQPYSSPLQRTHGSILAVVASNATNDPVKDGFTPNLINI